VCCVIGVYVLFRVWNEQVLNARVEKLTTSGHVNDIYGEVNSVKTQL